MTPQTNTHQFQPRTKEYAPSNRAAGLSLVASKSRDGRRWGVINFITRPFNRRKMAALEIEHTRLVQKAAKARNGHNAVSGTQDRLQAVTAQILQLEARL